jgi:hypothetical protein
MCDMGLQGSGLLACEGALRCVGSFGGVLDWGVDWGVGECWWIVLVDSVGG